MHRKRQVQRYERLLASCASKPNVRPVGNGLKQQPVGIMQMPESQAW